jgi:hypothetical protein
MLYIGRQPLKVMLNTTTWPLQVMLGVNNQPLRAMLEIGHQPLKVCNISDIKSMQNINK